MKLLAATRSAGKQKEIRRLLEAAGHEVVFPDEVGLHEREEEERLETEDTFQGNALRKAEYFAKRSGLATFADDSGLEVFALGGEPGVRSKRFAGVTGPSDVVDPANNAELMRRLQGAPERRRAARYRCVLVLLRAPGGLPEVFEGSVGGRILEAPSGTGGFGYDPYFFCTEIDKSFGEAEAAEKDAVSHRGRALQALMGALGPA